MVRRIFGTPIAVDRILMLIGAVLTLPLWLLPLAVVFAFARVLGWISDRQRVESIKRQGRWVTQQEFQQSDEPGTLIVYRKSPGVHPSRSECWWTPIDVESEYRNQHAARRSHGSGALETAPSEAAAAEFDAWCCRTFLSPELGTARMLAVTSGAKVGGAIETRAAASQSLQRPFDDLARVPEPGRTRRELTRHRLSARSIDRV